MVKEEIEKKIKDKYVLKEVTVQTDTAIGIADTNEIFSNDRALLLEILNKLDRIEKALIG